MQTSPNKKQLVIGNWKMNGSSAANAGLLRSLLPVISSLEGVEVALCPPFPYLSTVADLLDDSDVALGAQNLSTELTGAYTGEVGGTMLRDIGCRFVLVGHSERRALYGEDDACVAKKFATALQAGLIPVLCVGETLVQRQSGETQAIVTAQLNAVLNAVGFNDLVKGVIAYEPVWAIGTGETATPEQAQAVHRHIRQWLASQHRAAAADCRILYGGSVKADNAEQLFSQPDIDGGLIGGASLDAMSFAAICSAAQVKPTS
ncbi:MULTISPECIES: triose-phosphate isomerase [Pseudomonas]|jgi:triosephosphate isomerase|uniref:Triosephosphate isomerase n=2 Tax=Pseudomonas TaxID=286 RepID=A0ABY3PXP7_9PSED|nr:MULTISPECIES: triose-phosphate isomerase [Pseudomonas]QYY80514.1 triose-phosphate isomerase [Pseudomonas germanica]UFP98722.1 triose-phosphate isomerase [Pseudomonas fitomaticsae]